MAEAKYMSVDTRFEGEVETEFYIGIAEGTSFSNRKKIINSPALINYNFTSNQSHADMSFEENATIDKKIDSDNELFPRQVIAYTSDQDYFLKTQRWLCHVELFDGKTIFAKLTDLVQPGTIETAEFDIEEVSLEDRPLVKKGAAFYWSVGLANEKRQIAKKSLIRFQRLIELTETDYDEAMDRYNSIHKKIVWE